MRDDYRYVLITLKKIRVIQAIHILAGAKGLFSGYCGHYYRKKFDRILHIQGSLYNIQLLGIIF